MAIASEGRNNMTVLNDSFMQYYNCGVVLRDFSTATVERCVGDALFVKHVQSAQLEMIYEYLRNLRLANSYREKAERLKLNHDNQTSAQWLKRITDMWGNNLKQCETSIGQIITLRENDSRRG